MTERTGADPTLVQRRNKLLFGVRRSIRYHCRRQAFFDRYRTITSALSVFFGSATAAAILKQRADTWGLAAASLVSVLSAIDLVVGSSKQARVHESLYRRFTQLERKISGVGGAALTAEALRRFKQLRLDIEVDEPPVYLVLDALCHNDQARAQGLDPSRMMKVCWFQRIFAQVIDLAPHWIEQQKSKDPAPQGA